MLTEEQGLTAVDGFNVYDTVLIKHLIDKLLSKGLVIGKELPFVSSLYSKALIAAHDAIEVDISEIGNQRK